MVFRHPLAETFQRLGKNARACILFEPMWGIPNGLVSPYATMFQLALGLTNPEVGNLVTITLFVSSLAGQLSGILTDKLGRRRTMLLFELISYSLPCLCYAVAGNVYYFVAGAIFAGFATIPGTAWNCLFIEPTHPREHVHVFTMINLAQLTAAFFSPLAGLLVTRFDLVPAVRGLYFFSFIVMSAKTAIVFLRCEETERGKTRMAETRGVPIHKQLRQAASSYREIFGSRALLLILAASFAYQLFFRMSPAFVGTIIMQRMRLPDSYAAYFAFLKSFINMVGYFVIIPRVSTERFRNPLMLGFGAFAAAAFFLILPPVFPIFQLFLSVVLEALALSIVHPLIQALTAGQISGENRANVFGIINGLQLLAITPFGSVFGLLSAHSTTLPYVAMMAVSLGAIALVRPLQKVIR